MSKRGSPMGGGPGLGPSAPGKPDAALQGAPPAKRARDNGGGSGGSGGSGSGGGGGGAKGQDIDPDQMGDVLSAAGVDLREEESLLSNGLLNEPGGLAGARLLHAPKERDYHGMLLNSDRLRVVMARAAAGAGLKLGTDDGTSLGGLNQDPLSLVSTSCEEWLSSILAEAAAYSRHRRLALNPTTAAEQGETSRALKLLVQRDKESEKRHEALKIQLGLADKTADDEKGSEESMQRAANDTARMMTAAAGRKKKFTWMSDGGGGGAGASVRGARRQNNDPAKFKEIKEENGIVMRDLLPALERKHMGVKRSLIRGYAKLRN